MKERLDKLVVQKGLVETREKAQAFIIAGNVYVDGQRVIKPSRKVEDSSAIEVKLPNRGYASRGGIKLEHALDTFNIDVNNKNCMDIGSSTGGFTDCLLKRGAKHVVAVDVGKGLMHIRLKKDPRVILIEGFNARYIDNLKLEYKPELVVIDVSFISLRLILKPLVNVVEHNCDIVALIKPQFELERGYKGFRGVVKDSEKHVEILKKLHSNFIDLGYNVIDYTFSPIKGPKGNIEFFVWMKKSEKGEYVNKGSKVFDDEYFAGIVENAGKQLSE